MRSPRSAPSQGIGPYNTRIQSVQEDIVKLAKTVDSICGIKEVETGLAPPQHWDLVQDKQMMQAEQPLQVARCTKIIDADTDNAKYVINIKQQGRYVVGLGERVASTDIEESMRVGVDRNKHQIQMPLPPKARLLLRKSGTTVCTCRRQAACRSLTARTRHASTHSPWRADRSDCVFDDLGGKA